MTAGLLEDTEVQAACSELAAVVEAAYDLLLGRREDALAAAMGPLDREEAKLREEYRGIAEAKVNLESILPALAREAQRESDALVVAGRFEEGRAKQEESQKAAMGHAQMQSRQREIFSRLEAIEGERKVVAKRVFERWYTEVQQIVRVVERGLFVGLLDRVTDEAYAFQQRYALMGTIENPYGGLVKDSLLSNLTAPEASVEWRSGSKWYSGRRR